MNDELVVLVRSWLAKAQNDLLAAQRLSESDDLLLDVAIYHCQQSAEKVVKGFLLFHNIAIVRIHDVEELIAQAVEINSDFGDWLDVGDSLTRYATAFRYPTDPLRLQPDTEEFNKALSDAEGPFDFVTALLPDAVQP
jgi:HEPN domain-containing protein